MTKPQLSYILRAGANKAMSPVRATALLKPASRSRVVIRFSCIAQADGSVVETRHESGLADGVGVRVDVVVVLSPIALPDMEQSWVS